MKKQTIFLVFAVLVSLIQSCTYRKTEAVKPTISSADTSAIKDTTKVPGDTTSTTHPTVTATVHFAADIIPIMNKYNCTVCHSADSKMGQLDLVTSPVSTLKAKNLISTSNPTSSVFYTKFTGVHNEKNATQAELTKISTWIKEGAQNN